MSPSLGTSRSHLVRLDASRARRDRDFLRHPLGARTVEPLMGPVPVVHRAILPGWTPWIRKRFRVRAEIAEQLVSFSARPMDRRLRAQKRTFVIAHTSRHLCRHPAPNTNPALPLCILRTHRNVCNSTLFRRLPYSSLDTPGRAAPQTIPTLFLFFGSLPTRSPFMLRETKWTGFYVASPEGT